MPALLNAPPTKSLDISERAEHLLRGNAYLALKNVSCDYHDGILTLHGYLPTYYLKQIAQTSVAGLDGVSRIVNRIQVVGSAQGTPR